MPATTEIEVTMLFTRNNIPAQDIHTVTPGFPTIRIWDITQSNHDLIIDNETMPVVVDGPENDGFYKYIFTNANGFDETHKYVCLFNAGTSIPSGERYNQGSIVPDWGNEILDGQTSLDGKITTIDTVVDGIDSQLDTVEGKVDSIDTKINGIDTVVDEVLNVTTYLRKFESNRTLVNVNTGELIVYDDDCSTVLWKFRLLDEEGAPNVESVAERLPLAGGNAPWTTCI